MRYKLNENIAIAGLLPAGTTVNVSVLDLETDSLVVLSSNVCVESSVVPGLYIWNTSNIQTPVNSYKTMFYRMTDGTHEVQGKFVYGGYVDEMADSLEYLPTAIWTYTI